MDVTFDDVIAQVFRTVSSGTKRAYGQTYQEWAKYAEATGIDPLGLSRANVSVFLSLRDTGLSSRKRELSALRTLARAWFVLSESSNAYRVYSLLSVMRAPEPEYPRLSRKRYALTPEETARALAVWDGDRPIEKRNNALIHLLFTTGLRREEVVSLKWEDVDLDAGIIVIQHGKGDRQRIVVVCGQRAIEVIRHWRADCKNQYVFPAVRKGDHIREENRPMTGASVYDVVKATSTMIGVRFTPHDARRTHITEALDNGTPIADVQAQAGHSDPSGTLSYAMPRNAKDRKQRLSLRYSGDT